MAKKRVEESRYHRVDVLVELGRSWRPDGVEVRRYRCGWDRLEARVHGDGRDVELGRKLGVVCPGVRLSVGEVERVVAFLRWWEEHRTRWAAFYWTGAGHPPGYGCYSAWYEPPGDGPGVRVASKALGKIREGRDFDGEDVRFAVDPPERVAGGFDLVQRVVRKGERFGRPEGEEVGGRYRAGDLSIEADRNDVVLRCENGWIAIERDEHLFLERLLAIERRTGGAKAS